MSDQLPSGVMQNEWLKARLADLQMPRNSPKTIEEWLIECGMPNGDQQVPAPEASPGGAQAEDEMRRLSWLIEWATGIMEKYGDSCIYVRRGGLSWGAVALNYRADDEKLGVFDLQAKHDSDMIARVEQINRLIADRNEQRDRVATLKAENAALQDRWRRALEAAVADMPEPLPDMEFGFGNLCIDTGRLHDVPAVFIAPAKIPGEVGTSAKREGRPLNALVPGEIVMTFPTDRQAKAAADALCNVLPTPAPEAVNVDGSPLLEWAVSKWNSEVKNRPLVNVHRRSFDDTWRQVIRWAGGDPVALVGAPHDELLAAAETNAEGK